MNKNALFVLLGALAGGVVGLIIFSLLAKNGAYGFAIPGVLVGIGASFRRGAPWWVSVVSGLIGLCAGLGAIWKMLPFVMDKSLGYFVSHLQDLPTYQVVLVALGTAIAFWLPFRRRARGE